MCEQTKTPLPPQRWERGWGGGAPATQQQPQSQPPHSGQGQQSGPWQQVMFFSTAVLLVRLMINSLVLWRRADAAHVGAVAKGGRLIGLARLQRAPVVVDLRSQA